MDKVIAITRGIFCQEMRKIRVYTGYLLGLSVLAGELNAFLKYSAASGEAVNALEAFIVAEHTGSTFQCLVLGYLLIIASAPFIMADTYLVLYRSSRRSWNAGALYYLCNFVFRSFWGLIAVAVAHLGNYFLPWYPISSPCPGYFADGGSGQWMPFCCYLVFIVIFAVISFLAVKKVDMLSRAEEG